MQINTIMEPLIFTVPLSWEAHQMATQFRQQQLNAQKAKQVYLNTLSVYAVNHYLKCMEFEPDWQSSDSFNPILQKVTDVADLKVRNIGTFECRPVLPNEQTVSIPLESLQNRRGYFAVQLNSELTQAKLLGFIKQVNTETIPLNQLQSLDVFLQYASQLENVVELKQWFQNVFEAGWETVESLFSESEIAWRTVNNTAVDLPIPVRSNSVIERMKLIELKPTDQQIGLLVRLTPRSGLETGIGVEIYPVNNQTYLPENLQLMVLDEAGEAVMQAEARTTKNIQLQFSGESGEVFSVQITFGETNVRETFVI